MISLADLRVRSVSPTWQEAVAVVQELVQTVEATPGSLERLPDLAHVALIANGDVVALPGSPASDHPVRHLGSVLGHLLENANAPPELVDLASRDAADPPQHQTVEEFSKALGFFERPGRRADIERLVARALAAEAQTRAADELRRLKERTLEAAEQADAQHETELQSEHSLRRGVSPLVLALAAATIAAVALGAYYQSGGRLRLPGLSSSPVSVVAAKAAPPSDVARVPLGVDKTADKTDAPAAAAGTPVPIGPVPAGPPASATPATPPAATTPPATPTPAPASGGGAVSSPVTPPGRVAVTPEKDAPANAAPAKEDGSILSRAAGAVRRVVNSIVGPARQPTNGGVEVKRVEAAPVRAPSRPHRPAPPALSPSPPPVALAAAPPADEPQVTITHTEALSAPASAAAAADVAEAVVVYTNTDASVQPPVMVRPLLPALPPAGLPPDALGTFDLLIDENGDVEQVRLVSPTNRYQERMLVAHAKSWKFRPALRDGRPVKYRTRVRLTI